MSEEGDALPLWVGDGLSSFGLLLPLREGESEPRDGVVDEGSRLIDGEPGRPIGLDKLSFFFGPFFKPGFAVRGFFLSVGVDFEAS